MAAHLQEWAHLLVRWAHVIVGVAWIGASFYFNWLENRLDRRQPRAEGVAGQLWAIHGGGFYHLRKYEVAPPTLPAHLHWFKWEAYTTWITGFLLLIIVFYLNAETHLIDPGVADLTPTLGIVLGIATLIVSWLVYDGLCRSPLGDRPALLSGLLFALLMLLAFGLSEVFSGRAAYLHVGAAIGTCMVANVFRVIIPSQKALVRAMESRDAPDPAHGRRALVRSRHNNYLTLPVLFLMISSHFPMTYGHPWNWAVLGAISAVGIGVRHYFNVRHQPRAPRWLLVATAAGLLVVIIATAPRMDERLQGDSTPPPHATASDFSRVQAIVAQRCASCHAATPTFRGFTAAPAGLRLDTPERIRAHREDIARTAVRTRTMPPGNLTAMTEEERAILAAWVRSSAATR